MFTTAPTESNSAKFAIHHIICLRGDTLIRKFRFWQDNDKTIPRVLTGYEVRLAISNEMKQLFYFTLGVGTELTLITTNTIQLNIASVAMKVGYGHFKYDIQFTDLAGVDTTTIGGNFIIEKDITTKP